MNIIPTLEGGLRIEIEDPADWLLLHSIANDASQRDDTLSSTLSSHICDPDLHDDWKDFVMPELEEQFSTSLKTVGTQIRHAEQRHSGGPGALWIKPKDGHEWFSALNQARLALEDRYHFGNQSEVGPSTLEPVTRTAFLRSQLYCAFQSLLLEHVMN